MWVVEYVREGICIFRVNQHLLVSWRFLGLLAGALGCFRVRLLFSFVPILHNATYFYRRWSFQQDVNPNLNVVSVPRKQRTLSAHPLVLLKSVFRTLDLHELASAFFNIPQKKIWATRCSECVVFAENATNDRECFSADALFDVHG